jgi:hypothetical protein
MTHLDINDVINDAMLLVQREVHSHRVALRPSRIELAEATPTAMMAPIKEGTLSVVPAGPGSRRTDP